MTETTANSVSDESEIVGKEFFDKLTAEYEAALEDKAFWRRKYESLAASKAKREKAPHRASGGEEVDAPRENFAEEERQALHEEAPQDCLLNLELFVCIILVRIF